MIETQEGNLFLCYKIKKAGHPVCFAQAFIALFAVSQSASYSAIGNTLASLL